MDPSINRLDEEGIYLFEALRVVVSLEFLTRLDLNPASGLLGASIVCHNANVLPTVCVGRV
jgi:hypothetical protein